MHTSIDRAIWVAGIGEDNLVKLPGKGKLRGIDVGELEAAIARDKAAGLLPAGIIASVGGTSVGGTDDVAAVCAVAKRHGLYVHVDAAWAGVGDDLPGVPALLGRRRAGGFDRLQSAQMAGRAVRLLGPVRARPGKPGEDAGDPARNT